MDFRTALSLQATFKSFVFLICPVVYFRGKNHFIVIARLGKGRGRAILWIREKDGFHVTSSGLY